MNSSKRSYAIALLIGLAVGVLAGVSVILGREVWRTGSLTQIKRGYGRSFLRRSPAIWRLSVQS